MAKMTVKPPFDLAAHLAKPVSSKELESAGRRRRLLEQYQAIKPAEPQS